MDHSSLPTAKRTTPCCSIAATSASVSRRSRQRGAGHRQHHGQHSIAGGDYPTRRRESEAACAIINGHRGGVPYLRDATLEDLESGATRWSPSRTQGQACHHGRPAHRGRLRGFVKGRHEGSRTPDGRSAHQLSKDFEGSCVEADLMVDLANELPGLIGARSPAAALAAAPSTWSNKTRPRPSPKS